jgi:hypothetical protein
MERRGIMRWWGYDVSRRELEGYGADLRQFADIRLITLDDGPERGVRAALCRTGGGLAFTVLLDRGLDIGAADFRGIPLAWQSGTGAADPARHEPAGLGWLRTFHGGLLALCGLTTAGYSPEHPTDPATGEPLGLHGRIGTIPAYDVQIERDVRDDGMTLRLRGTVDEVSLFGPKLRLQRVLEFDGGGAEIRICDTVRNFGGLPAPLMILYHLNFGFPLLSPDSGMTSSAITVSPRDAAAEKGLASWATFEQPQAGYAEQVFWHELDGAQGEAEATLLNPALGLGVAVRFDASTLTHLTEWKQMGFGDYVLGIEPGNCLPVGRAKAREQGGLKELAPGESVTFTLALRVITP